MPVIGMLGFSGCTAFAFTGGIFIEPVTRDLHWSRAQFSSALLVQTMVGMLFVPFIGQMVDRFGSRRVALCGIVPFVLAFMLYAQVTGPAWQWWAAGAIMAVLGGFVSQVVWVKAIVGHFTKTRGLALAIVLCGSGLGGIIWPPMAAYIVTHHGWRMAYVAIGLSWGVVMLPMVYFLFPETAHKQVAKLAEPDDFRLIDAVKTRTFICLALAASIYTSISLALTVHMVPILQGQGLGLTAAAGLIGLIGIFAIIGRLVTGYLLDHCPTRPVAICIFLMPIAIALLLQNAHGSIWAAGMAVAVLGFANGGDGDVVAYVTGKQFRAAEFGRVYAPLTSLFSMASSAGPVVVSASYDHWHSYDVFLWSIIPMALIAAVSASLVPIKSR